MRILSIDFDYFIDTDIDTRNFKFPDGVDDKPEERLKRDWGVMYSKYPEIADIEVIGQFYFMCGYLYSKEFKGVYVADSHKEIECLIKRINPEEEVDVVHIDFHHDNYISGGNTLDCANWVRHLMNKKPDTNIVWIRREDSEIESLTGEFPYAHTTDIISCLEGDFDYLFLCFSPEWTPPHLRPLFNDMIASTI